jgi:hypothetical protein
MRWIDHEFVEIWAKPRVKLMAREKDRINGNKESNE